MDPSEPLYIIELGAGQGKFSFLIMKALEDLKSTLGFPFEKIVYVMTDFTNSNFEAWQAHPSLKKYFEEGRLDAGIFNAVQDSLIHLHHSNVTLSPGSSRNPVVIIANYLFDTLYHDHFCVRDGELLEGQISAGSMENEESDHLNPEIIERMNNIYRLVPTRPDGQYRLKEGEEEDQEWLHREWLLQWYQDWYASTNQDACFLLPIGAMRAVRRLSALARTSPTAGGRALLITADKGNANLQSFLGLSEPSIGLHGSFSMMVNYHAMALWTASRGGHPLTDPHEFSDLVANVFVLNGEEQGEWTAREDRRLLLDETCVDSSCREKR